MCYLFVFIIGATLGGVCTYNYCLSKQDAREHRENLEATIANNRSSYLNLVHEQRAAVLQRMVATVHVAQYSLDVTKIIATLRKECDLCATPVHAALLGSAYPDRVLNGMLVDKIAVLQRMSRCDNERDLRNYENAIDAINDVIAQLHPHP